LRYFDSQLTATITKNKKKQKNNRTTNEAKDDLFYKTNCFGSVRYKRIGESI